VIRRSKNTTGEEENIDLSVKYRKKELLTEAGGINYNRGGTMAPMSFFPQSVRGSPLKTGGGQRGESRLAFLYY